MSSSSVVALGAIVLFAAGACAGSSDSPDAAGARDARASDAGAGAPDAPRADSASALDAARLEDGSVPADAGASDGVSSDLGVAPEAGPGPVRVTSMLVTDEHRFVPGAMFGGWGPHLGHLVRSDRSDGTGSDLYWVDDLCTQGTGDCDVNVNRRVGIFRRDGDAWTRLGTVPLPAGVQQNTGALASEGELRAYGVDTTAHRIAECTFDLGSGASAGCTYIPLDIGLDANYVGAALSPAGAKIVWWTNVVDGGSGSFAYVAEYTVGWNGPRAGVLPGYGDCGYVNAAFRGDVPAVTFFGQVVTGSAPAWTFSTLVGESRLDLTAAVSWANALPPPPGDPVASTNDLWIDPATGDAHLVARTHGGAAAYYHRPVGGGFGPAQIVDASALRARWIVTEDTLAIVYGPNAGGLRLRSFPRAGVIEGEPLDVASADAEEVAVPDDLGPVVGIYPEASVYQSAAVTGLHFVVVGDTRQNEAMFFELSR